MSPSGEFFRAPLAADGLIDCVVFIVRPVQAVENAHVPLTFHLADSTSRCAVSRVHAISGMIKIIRGLCDGLLETFAYEFVAWAFGRRGDISSNECCSDNLHLNSVFPMHVRVNKQSTPVHALDNEGESIARDIKLAHVACRVRIEQHNPAESVKS